MTVFLTMLALACAVPIESDGFNPNAKNVLLILADDVGVVQTEQVPMPVLDLLQKNGVTFTNAWSQPSCSPTRFSILTGKHPHQTGLGSPVAWGKLWEPSPVHATIGDFVDGSALLGKWHLSNRFLNPAADPVTWGGFDFYCGNLNAGLGQFGSDSYYDWLKTTSVPGSDLTEVNTTYATVQTTDDALEWIHDQKQPWFCMVSYNAAHKPWHDPPKELHSIELDGSSSVQYQAMLQALDTEVGRLLAGLSRTHLASTLVIWMGDNGPPSEVTDPYVPPEFGKGSVYQGGIHVPLVIASMDTNQPGREVDEPVMAVDIFETALGALMVPSPETGDGESLMPFLRNLSWEGRGWSYAETFAPNGTGPYDKHQETALNDDGYKLIRRQGEADELYDLLSDPAETSNLLLGELSQEQSSALQELEEILSNVR